MTTETEILLPGIVERISEPPPPLNLWPYFTVAYWPKGRNWAIQHETFESACSPSLKSHVEKLRKNGWTHITIMKLPELGETK